MQIIKHKDLIINTKMSTQDYFQIYIDIISDAFRKVRKIGFKKSNPLKELLDVV